MDEDWDSVMPHMLSPSSSLPLSCSYSIIVVVTRDLERGFRAAARITLFVGVTACVPPPNSRSVCMLTRLKLSGLSLSISDCLRNFVSILLLSLFV